MIPLSAFRQAVSAAQWLWLGQGHPCCLNKALCYGWVTAGRASLLPHCANRGGVCVWWGMCSHTFLRLSLLLTYIFISLSYPDTIPNNAERSKG